MSTVPATPSASVDATRRLDVARWREGQGARDERDDVAVEEPLEIRVGYGPADARVQQSVAVTMRTPGHDVELAVGFLRTEGIVASAADVASAAPCGGSGNVVRVELAPDVAVDLARLERNFYTTSSCGVCGKASIDAVMRHGASPVATSGVRWRVADLAALPHALDGVQPVFARTGGVHAAALFDARCALGSVREDVGRHNAVDKVIGRAVLDDAVPLAGFGLLVSGRVSFEIVQKALMGGVPLVVAVGAPSSLAIELAQGYGLTLAAFAREGRLNVYAHPGRVDQGADG